MTFKVYLAGPITGLQYDATVSWRDDFTRIVKYISDGKIDCYSPMRGCEDLDTGEAILDTLPDSVASCDTAVFRRDKWDVVSSDLVVVNLLGAERVSIGTMFEMAWAEQLGIPVVLIMEKTGNIHEHTFVRMSHTIRVENVVDAQVQVVKTLVSDTVLRLEREQRIAAGRARR